MALAVSSSSSEVLLTLKGLSKTFEGQKALDDVDLAVAPGEVHALLGQNGSGKSTLIKILAGYHKPDPGGTGAFRDAELELGSGQAARDAGMRFIHQDLGLLTDLDAVDNLALGERYTASLWISDRRERRAAHKILASYGVHVDVAAPLWALSAAQRSMLAIVRAIHRGGADSGLLVLDEPTASLPDSEVRQLFELVRHLKSLGGSVLYVTHRLSEVFEISDRVSVLRDGRRIATRETKTLDHDELVELIIGRPLEALHIAPAEVAEESVLTAQGITGGAVRDVDLQVKPGEIVGVTGLVGSGYDQLLGLIFGARTRDNGRVVVSGREVPAGRPNASIARGVAFVPADRKAEGAIATWTVRENLTLPRIRGVGPFRWLGRRSETAEARRWASLLGVVPADPERLLFSLSGGNQQKVVLARWLRCGADVLLLDEPTNGVDTGAKRGIYRALAETAAAGGAIVLSSSDLEELSAVCSRVLVMRDGVVCTELRGASVNPDTILIESLREPQQTQDSRLDTQEAYS